MASLEAFAGYWNRPDADEKAIRDGWYFTGDLASTTRTATCGSPAASTT